ncbi:MAG: manganese efflux pump [Candidatus Jordarchaeaceae archaeon]
MICESIKKAEEEGKFDPLSLQVLLLFSIATSIDALAVGVSFAFLGAAILSSLIIIGIVTFLLSFLEFLLVIDLVGYLRIRPK